MVMSPYNACSNSNAMYRDDSGIGNGDGNGYGNDNCNSNGNSNSKLWW